MNTESRPETDVAIASTASRRRFGRVATILALVTVLIFGTAGASYARDLGTKTYGGCTMTAGTPYVGNDLRGYAKVAIRCTSRQTVASGSYYQVLNEVPNAGDSSYTGSFPVSGTLAANVTYTWTLSWSYNMYHSYPWYTQAYVGMTSWGGAKVKVESASCGC